VQLGGVRRRARTCPDSSLCINQHRPAEKDGLIILLLRRGSLLRKQVV
jgi:hypothetical protein